MQRNHYLLNNIILPYIHQNRLLSTARTLNKSSINVEHGSSFSYPTWSYPLATLPGNDPDLPSPTAIPERSRAAQTRAELRDGFDKPKARRRELDSTETPQERPLYSPRAGPSTAKRKSADPIEERPPSPSPERRTMWEETVHTALTKVVAIHARPSVPVDYSNPTDASTPTSTDLAAPTSTVSAPARSAEPTTPRPVSQPETLPPPRRLPPALNALLRARQFRLAVFHLINSPHLSQEPTTISYVADWMEREGAGKLAGRLRRSVRERTWLDAPDAGMPAGTRLRLAGDERDGEGDLGRWNGYWKIGPIPPPPITSTDSPSKSSSTSSSSIGSGPPTARRQRITSHFNAHLAYLLRKDARGGSHTTLLPLDSSPRTPGASFPAPKPNLRQLRALLHSIRILERKHDFVPDRRTANIIIGCWLACVQPAHRASSRDTFDPYIVRSDAFGEEWLVEKTPSQRIFRPAELMALFGIVSRAMEEAVRDVEERFKRVVRGMKKVDGRWVVPEVAVGGEAAGQDATPVIRPVAERETGPRTRISNRGTGNTKAGLDAEAGDAATTGLDSAAGPPAAFQAGTTASPQGALERLSRKDDGDIDYDLHIRPFAEMVLQSLKRAGAGGKDETRQVLGWKKEMRDRMELLGLGRVRVRQHLGLPVD